VRDDQLDLVLVELKHLSKEVKRIKGGCFTLVLNWVTIFAIVTGVPTPWGRLKIDLFWPAIHLEAK
jgi:hypothetical protein